MRENKYDKLLLLSVVLIIASAILLAISGYNIYFKGATEPNLIVQKKAAPIVVTLPLRDSLEKLYTNTVSNIKNNLRIESTKANEEDIKNKMFELDTLKEEIKALLSHKDNNNDLLLAKVKIEELQQKVYFLQSKYSNVENENKRLQKLIVQLLSSKSSTINLANKPVPAEKIIAATENINAGKIAFICGCKQQC